MQSIPEEEKTEFRNVKIEKEDKGFIRNLYTKLLPTRASKPIYLSYFVGRLVTSFIFNIIMYFSLQFFIVNFNSLDAIMWGMIVPLLIIFFFTDRSNMLFKDYYNFLDNNNLNIFIVIIF